MVLKKNKKRTLNANSKKKTARNRDFKSKDVKIRGYYSIILFLMLIFVDRLTKIWAMNAKNGVDYGVVAITYTINTGAGFSTFQNMNTILLWLSIIILGLMIFFNDRLPKFSLVMISAGIVGNLIDRIFYGSVIDFINFKFWPIFNVADSLICIGVAWWIIIILKYENNTKKNQSKN